MVCVLGGACAEGDYDPEKYPAELGDIAADYRLEVSVLAPSDDAAAPRRVVAVLRRFFGQGGTAYESCPTFSTARATINGAPMAGDPGGDWDEVWHCSEASFSLDIASVPEAFDAAETVIQIEDGSNTIRLVTSNMFVVPTASWSAPADGAVRSAERASIRIEPSARALLWPQIAFLPESGTGEPVFIDWMQFEITPEAVTFPIPELPLGATGTIVVSGGSAPLFGAEEKECSGVGACLVMRSSCYGDACSLRIPAAPLDDDLSFPVTVVQ